jgi:hypothetical protein
MNGANGSPETFSGIVHSTFDALLVFEACLQGKLPRVTKRLRESERKYIRSGSIFVFEEGESGIKRWTDGKVRVHFRSIRVHAHLIQVWSPSRILDNFLIYREVEKKISRVKKKRAKIREEEEEEEHVDGHTFVGKREKAPGCVLSNNVSLNPGTLESPKALFILKNEGLVKKTISVIIDQKQYHLVCYYSVDDYLEAVSTSPINNVNRALQIVSHCPVFALIYPRIELLVQPNWRKPPELDENDPMDITQVDDIAKYLSTEFASATPFEHGWPPFSTWPTPSNQPVEDNYSVMGVHSIPVDNTRGSSMIPLEWSRYPECDSFGMPLSVPTGLHSACLQSNWNVSTIESDLMSFVIPEQSFYSPYANPIEPLPLENHPWNISVPKDNYMNFHEDFEFDHDNSLQ